MPTRSALPLALAALLAATLPLAAQQVEELTETPLVPPPAAAPAAPAPAGDEVSEQPPAPAPAAPAPAGVAVAAQPPAPAMPAPGGEAVSETPPAPTGPADAVPPVPATELTPVAPPAAEAPNPDAEAVRELTEEPPPPPAPEPVALPEIAVEPYVEPPMPSPLEDPMGALEWLLMRSEGNSHDLSPWGMYRAADIVVKLVMLGLALASLITWTVWLAKTLELAGARMRAAGTLRAIRGAQTLAEALRRNGNRGGPAAAMLHAAREEVGRSDAAVDHAGGDGVKERVSSTLGRIEARAGRRAARGTGVLATIGSTAPFVGLFGTVWGIMNAFISISETQTTNLAVVAPGIAEALLATAIGLVAAIPAVVIYNVFVRAIAGYRQLLGDAAAGIERLVSRDLDYRNLPPVAAVPAAAPLRTALAAE